MFCVNNVIVIFAILKIKFSLILFTDSLDYFFKITVSVVAVLSLSKSFFLF